MATSFYLTSGFPWVNGSIASSTALNDSVDLATFSSVTASIIIGFDASSNACDVPYSFQISNGLVHNPGTSWHTTNYGMTIGDSASSSMQVIGQSTSNALTTTWGFSSVAAAASATIATVSNANPINIKGSVLNLQPASGTNVTNGLASDRQIALLSTLAYSSTMQLSFVSSNTLQAVTITGPLTLSATGYTVGAQISLAVINGSSSSQTLSVDSGWIFIGNTAPVAIAGGKVGLLSLTPFGAANTSTLAAYAVQP